MFGGSDKKCEAPAGLPSNTGGNENQPCAR